GRQSGRDETTARDEIAGGPPAPDVPGLGEQPVIADQPDVVLSEAEAPAAAPPVEVNAERVEDLPRSDHRNHSHAGFTNRSESTLDPAAAAPSPPQMRHDEASPSQAGN